MLNLLLHHVCLIFKYSDEKHEIGPKIRRIIEEITQKNFMCDCREKYNSEQSERKSHRNFYV